MIGFLFGSSTQLRMTEIERFRMMEAYVPFHP